MNQVTANPDQERINSLRTLAGIIYLLQGFSLAFGGLPMLVGVILNYAKKIDAQGTWLESHFDWQINTFWFTLLLALAGWATFPIGVGYFLLIFGAIFLIYRVIRGWTRLSVDQPITESEL